MTQGSNSTSSLMPSTVASIATVYAPVVLSLVGSAFALSTMRKKDEFVVSSRLGACTVVSSILYSVSQAAYLILGSTAPASAASLSIAFAVISWLFLSYSMLVQLFTTLVAYLHIRWHVQLQSGSLGYQFHVPCFLISLALAGLFYSADSFGVSGVWCLATSSSSGSMVTFTIATLALFIIASALACEHATRSTHRDVLFPDFSTAVASKQQKGHPSPAVSVGMIATLGFVSGVILVTSLVVCVGQMSGSVSFEASGFLTMLLNGQAAVISAGYVWCSWRDSVAKLESTSSV